MTEQERTAICGVCTNREFNPKQGIICGLTHEKATFIESCPDYVEDERVLKFEKRTEDHYAEKSNLKVNTGRLALFLIGGIYGFIGVRYLLLRTDVWDPGFYQIAGFANLMLAIIFIGLGILSLQRASLAMIIGLSVYCAFILLSGLVSPLLIFSGLIWKIIVISWLAIGISYARAHESKLRRTSEKDMLDQF